MVQQAQKMNRDRAAMTVEVRKRLSMETLEKKTYTGSPVQIDVSLVSMVLVPPMPGEGGLWSSGRTGPE